MSSNESDENTLYELQEILRIFIESDLRELSLDYRDISLRVSKDGPLPAPAAASTPDRNTAQASRAAAQQPVQQPGGQAPVVQPPASTVDAADADHILVHSPSAGYFHRRPSPNEPPYVEVGQSVHAGAPVCIVEVMKMFTEVTASCAGIVTEIRVENAAMVAEGDVLMVLKPEPETT